MDWDEFLGLGGVVATQLLDYVLLVLPEGFLQQLQDLPFYFFVVGSEPVLDMLHRVVCEVYHSPFLQTQLFSHSD